MTAELGRKLEEQGAEVLAIPAGLGRSEFVLAKLAELRKLPAFVVRDGEIGQWHFEGVMRHEDRLYLHGPYLAGVFLEEAVQRSFSAALPYLGRLVRTLATLKRSGLLVDFLQTDSVYFLDGGGVLFLPTALMRELRSMHPETYRMQAFDVINHPDATDPEKSLSFSLAALLYRIALGHYPFEAQTEEEIHNLTRSARLLAPSLAEPGLREAVSRQILAGLGRTDAPPPSLEQWQEIIAECKREGLHRDISEIQRQQIRSRAEQEQQRIGKAYRRKVFWQRHWKTVAIVSVAVVIGGTLAGSFLKNILAPRQTRGFPPRQVVESYYLGINDLDHTLMEDCVVDGAGKDTIREVVNIYVLSRVSLGYEGRSHIIPADLWDADGRPQLEAPQTVYGVTGLELTEERGEPDPLFLARYTKWLPEPGENPESDPARAEGPGFTSLEIRERVYLKWDRKDWVIYRFEPR